jgi:hypothetical protein
MNRADAICARLLDNQKSRYGATLDVVLQLEDEDTDCAWALRRLLILSTEHTGTLVLADPVVSILTKEDASIPRMLAGVVKYITEDDDGVDVLAVHRKYHPEAWDAVQAAELALVRARMVSLR